MIKIHRTPMSDELRTRYEQQVLGPGQKWLEKHTHAKRPRPEPYWSKIHADIAKAFHLRCAYTTTWLSHGGHRGSCNSIDEDCTKAYDWDNFRYCVGWFNSKKQNALSNQILDPMLVEDDWFEISWPDLQLQATEHCPEHLRSRAEFMLEKLGLRNGDKVMRDREAYTNIFREEGESALPFIDRQAPLVARAIRKELARRATTTSPT